jgi:rRNA maturation endonuclease Nob1
LKEEITKITSVVVQYNQEWKYYTQILTTIKKEIEEAEKNKVKTAEEDEIDEDEVKVKKPKDKKKEEVTTSSTTNEVKQIET